MRTFFKMSLSLVCVTCVLVGLLPGQVLAAESGRYLYEVQDGKATITGCTWENASYLDIPRTIDGYPVVGIGAGAFQERNDVLGVIIPEGVETIGYRAFWCCRNLSWVVLPDSLTTIGEEAFSVCQRLQSVDFGEGLKTIDCAAFSHCSNLGYELEFSEGLETIGNSAFYKCYTLETVRLPKSLKRLGSRSFAYCSSLMDFYIPDGVDSVGTEVLLDSAYYKSTVNWSQNIFYVNSYLMYAKRTVTGSFDLKGITHIADGAFENCNYLTEVILPEGLEVIGVSAFESCDQLQRVSMPSSVTTIGDKAFYECKALTDIRIPDSVTYMGEDVFTKSGYYNETGNWENGAFYMGDCLMSCKSTVSGALHVRPGTKTIASGAMKGLKKLTELHVPESLTEIGKEALADCTGLTVVNLAGNVTTIGEKAFYNCSALKTLHLGKGVLQIGDSAFAKCSRLESITVDTGNKTYRSQDHCLIQGKTLVLGCKNSVIPRDGSVTEIGTSAFECCLGLTELVIPDNILTVGDGAFRDCENLVSVRLGNGVQVVRNGAFENCDSLSRIDLGQSIQAIEYRGFGYNHSLKQLELPGSLRSVGEEAFCNATALETIHFREGLLRIGKNSFSYCDSLKHVALPDSLETVDSAAFYDCAKLETIKLGEGITTIADSAFMYCESLISLTIPHSVQTIGSHAFSECYALQHLDLGRVRVIERSAFSYCKSLTQIHIPSSVTEIGLAAFAFCPKIESMTVSPNNPYYFDSNHCIIKKQEKILAFGCKNSIIPTDGSVTSVNGYSFAGATGLTFISVPDQVTWIGAASFVGCTGLQEIHLPFIGSEADSYDGRLGRIFTDDPMDQLPPPSLKRVVIHGGSIVGNSAFKNCRNLQEIILPETITWIGYFAFENCTGLEKVVLPGNVTTIKDESLLGTAPNAFLYLSKGQDATITYAKDRNVRHYIGGLITFKDQNGQCIDKSWYALGAKIKPPVHSDADAFTWTPVPDLCKGNQTFRLGSPAGEDSRTSGDLNGDNQTNNLDVEYLLWHTLFPDTYSVSANADYNKDSLVNNLDVEYLLWHTLFPETYPV